MSGMGSQKELVERFTKAFEDADKRTFGVQFPGMKTKLILRPLVPRRYKEFMQTFQACLNDLIDVGLSTFEQVDGITFKGRELIDKDEAGKVIVRETYRIETSDGDKVEIPKKAIKTVQKPSAESTQTGYEKVLWGNAQKFLRLLFPEAKEAFSIEYIDENLHIPFFRTLWDLVVELNGLGDVIPFVKKLFLEGEEDVKGKKRK